MKRISDLKGLAAAGLVPPEREDALHRVASRWAVALTPAVQARIDPADPADPIARQFVPSVDELQIAPDEREDPIGDADFTPLKGLTHRYPDRVLLKPTHACPVYCRFCFRREAVGPGGESLAAAELEALFRALVAMRVKPYYLHHADLAPGTGHFRTSIATGQALVRGLRGRVSGLYVLIM